MKAQLIGLLSAVMLAACASQTEQQQAAQMNKQVCDLPYTTYQATVTGHCQVPKAVLPQDIERDEMVLEMRPYEQIPEVFFYNKGLKYAAVTQEQPAPLVFSIAGTGGSYDGSKMRNLEKGFYQQGYHVISLSSPTFSNFIVNASTGEDHFPGFLEKDAEILYEVLEKTLAQVKAEKEIEVTEFYLTGYSLGGAHSAYLAKLDQERKQFNFKKVLLVNPPVSLYNSVSVLDGYLDIDDGDVAKRDRLNATFENIIDRFSDAYASMESASFTQDSIYQLFGQSNLTEDELKLLIGTSFRMSSAEMIYAIDTTFNYGAVIYKDHEISKYENNFHSFVRASRKGFLNYFDRAIVAHYTKEDPNLTRDELIERLSLKAIEDFLVQADNVSVVTNADDIILADGEVEYLQSVFKDRAKIFPQGGHCGNMDRKDFVAYINKYFAK
ncbi:alpha/beta hydrolase [Catenovulum sp. SM1970]|uniref:alpha/beta hydrolase n=1 Tax=Marinifaba aquimaris TaxID=2741323 RepID=UPI001574687C|nr:alpha/beta hydrolase [Marinifaba aquimaris]NTS78088.1 alpha/beta hydrolase [Marinifaba aquimaris]